MQPSALAPPTPIRTDALVIGAGPVGLYAAFQLGLLGLDAHLVDAQAAIGGQCQALYGDKPIYDIPALPSITGAELGAALLAQLAQITAFAPLPARLHLGQQIRRITRIEHLEHLATGRFAIETTAGLHFDAACILLATGVGAFVPKSLNVPGLDTAAACVHHWPGDVADFDGQVVCIVGDEDLAVDWACALAERGRTLSLTLNHRRAKLNTSAASQARLDALLAQGRLQFTPGVLRGLQMQGEQLQALELLQPDGSPKTLPCTRLGIVLGLAPQMGPLADWGLVLERKLLPVDTARFATTAAGIFAVGDAVTYAGKLKLIACGFHEATLAAHAALAHCFPERVAPLQYTSSSTLLQSRLGQGQLGKI